MPLLDTLLSIVAPHYCLCCGCEGSLLCALCAELELSPLPSRCYRCKQVTSDFSVCSSCRRQTVLRHVWVRTAYNDVSSQPLLAYKFERARAAYKPLATAMYGALPLLPEDTLIMSVPSSTGRIRERGYDHTKLIARELAQRTGLLQVWAVARTGQSHQFGASRSVRLKQLQGTFVVTDLKHVKSKKVLLVDDVITTGATLETLAKALKQAGASQVDALVFAQKI